MIKEFKENKEYHKNGTLSYREIIGIIEPIFVDIYNNNKTLHKFHKRDNYYIKMLMEKTFDNGQLAWLLEYNENGEVIRKEPHKRKDGTLIIY